MSRGKTFPIAHLCSPFGVYLRYRSGDPSAPLFSVELDNLDSGSVQAAAQLLSREIADERKADPRWAEDESRSNSAMTSHIVQTQLQAKLELHNLLIKLLLEWTHRGGTMWHSLDEVSLAPTHCDPLVGTLRFE